MIAVARKPVAKCVSVVAIHADVYFMPLRCCYDQFLAGWVAGRRYRYIPSLAILRDSDLTSIFRKPAALSFIFIFSLSRSLGLSLGRKSSWYFFVSHFYFFPFLPFCFSFLSSARKSVRARARDPHTDTLHVFSISQFYDLPHS